MLQLDNLLAIYSPPLDPSLVIAISSDYHLADSDSIPTELTGILSQLIHEQEEQHQSIKITPGQQQPTPPPSSIETQDDEMINQLQAFLPDIPESTISQAILDAPEPKDVHQIYYSLTSLPTPTQKRKKKKPDKIIFNDVRQTSKKDLQIERAEQLREQTKINNDWVLVNSQISHLATLLGIEPTEINSIYYRKKCNLVLTLEELLNVLELKKRREASGDPEWSTRLQLQLEHLKAIHEPTENDQCFTRLLIVTELDSGNALDLLKFSEELHRLYGSLASNQFNSHPGWSAYPSSSSSTTFRNQQNQRVQATHFHNNQSSSSSSPSQPFSLARQPNKSARQDMIERLTKLEAQRENLQNQLNSSRQLIANSKALRINKQGIQNTISKMHADDLKAVCRQIDNVKFEIASLDVRRKNDPNSIDLHGLTKNQAIDISAECLQEWWDRCEYLRNNYHDQVQPFTIVTGAGVHSANGQSTLRPAISNFLEQNQWKWKSDDERSNGQVGALIVTGKVKNTRR
ncbi:hypothetical protein MJO28_009071 [Puccinia striiformis f. sp. tritici]|uniref:Smr domain-containing protein n=2 Tax=Puccinia striiformis TaxID=27350 RepID=A0A2S4VC65_9BASI|nr:hypothetical protein MJO28_009071 [Puccinia striiformis f. sp. tritici]POW07030.1 hypothetical protein PSTT_08534 [Puccinia striiformis]